MPQAFKPFIGGSVSLAASSVNATVAIASGADTIRIWNRGPNTAAVRWGLGAQTAVLATDLKLGTDQDIIVRKGNSDTFAAICNAAETAALEITPGEEGM